MTDEVRFCIYPHSPLDRIDTIGLTEADGETSGLYIEPLQLCSPVQYRNTKTQFMLPEHTRSMLGDPWLSVVLY